jgi:hypothetical protein
MADGPEAAIAAAADQALAATYRILDGIPVQAPGARG